MAEFIKEALDEACRGVDAGHGGPFGAIVVRDGRVVAVGHNMVLATNDATAHAEVTAIRNACAVEGTFDLSGCEMYASCYPCPAADAGFDDKEFHDYFAKLREPESLCTLSECTAPGKLVPFELWHNKDNKVLY